REQFSVRRKRQSALLRWRQAVARRKRDHRASDGLRRGSRPIPDRDANGDGGNDQARQNGRKCSLPEWACGNRRRWRSRRCWGTESIFNFNMNVGGVAQTLFGVLLKTSAQQRV